MTDQVKVRVTAEDEGVSTLLRTLSKQLGDVQKQQKRVNDETARGTGVQRSASSSIRDVVGNLKTLAASYGLFRVARFVKDQLDAADALSKLSQKSGLTTETLSKLAFAGETADVSIDQLGTSAKLFAKSIADLQKGGVEAADAFKSIGLSARDLKNLSPDQAFLKTLTALGSYRDGLEKSAVAQKIFGKSGEELIPLANQIAEEGFGSISDAAAKAGRVISTEAGRAAEDFNDNLARLIGRAKAAALTLGLEVVPAINDVIDAFDALQDAGARSTAETWGARTARDIRQITAFSTASTKTIAEAFDALRVVGVSVWAAIQKASHLDFEGARKEGEKSTKALAALRGSFVRNFQAEQDKLDQAEKDRAAKSSNARKGRGDKEKKDIILADSKGASEIAKARLAAEEHAREGEGKILAAGLALRDQEVERSFGKGLSSLAAYFAARRATIVEAGKEEVASLKASRDAIAKQPVATPVERVQRDDQVAQKNVDIKVAESKITEKLNTLDGQREDLATALAETIVGAEVRIQEARGQTSAAAKASLAHDVEEYRKALAKMGQLTAEQQKSKVATFQTTLTLKVDAQAAQEEIDRIFGDIDRKRTALDQDVNIGLRSQVSAQQELTQFEAARLPTLQRLADEMARFGAELDNPELQAAAADLKVRLEGIGESATKSARLAAEMGTDIRDSLEGDLSNFLGSTISQVSSLGEAFASLASSVVASIQQIIAKLIAAKAVESIARALGLAGFAAISGGAKAASGSAVTGASAFEFATGGYTGHGGKYQPAGVVHKGEYVFTKEQTRAIGVRRLATLARNPRPVTSWADVKPSIAPRSVRRPSQGRLPGYAEGGFVAPVTASLGDGHTLGGTITIGLRDGLVAHEVDLHLRSPDGKQRVLEANIAHKGKLAAIVRGAS